MNPTPICIRNQIEWRVYAGLMYINPAYILAQASSRIESSPRSSRYACRCSSDVSNLAWAGRLLTVAAIGPH